jgi:hypothetical protein
MASWYEHSGGPSGSIKDKNFLTGPMTSSQGIYFLELITLYLIVLLVVVIFELVTLLIF